MRQDKKRPAKFGIIQCSRANRTRRKNQTKPRNQTQEQKNHPTQAQAFVAPVGQLRGRMGLSSSLSRNYLHTYYCTVGTYRMADGLSPRSSPLKDKGVRKRQGSTGAALVLVSDLITVMNLWNAAGIVIPHSCRAQKWASPMLYYSCDREQGGLFSPSFS